MGIILGKSKLVFDELIGSNSFDEIFKNSIRDYFAYGFKSYEQFSKGSQIVKDRWKIFGKVLGEKWYFEKRKNGRNQITLKTTPSGADNPVDDLYFLHNLSKIGDYLNYLFDLDARSSLRGGISSLPVDIDELKTVEGDGGKQWLADTDEIEYSIIMNWLDGIEDDFIAAETDRVVRVNRQLNIWSRNTRNMTKSFRDKYANLSNRTKYLYDLGLIADLRDIPEERNKWLRLQWEKYEPSFKKYFNNKTSGDHFWYKSPVTMETIINGLCKDVDPGLKQSNINNFKAMCDFFSQYYPMGELGTIMSKRCDSIADSYDRECFSFKHNYLQKTLYDYNLIDILFAIENSYLCLIEYSHGTDMRSFEELLIPLEIRISVINGREYVLYYHVAMRRIMALRLEFIDKITVFSHVNAINKIQRRVQKTGKKIQRYIISEEAVIIDEEDIIRQVSAAIQMLPYIWGTDTSECIVDDQWKERLIDIDIPVIYHLEKEKYIGGRLKKEGRFQQNKEKRSVFPTKELRNWIRSFYIRVGVKSGDTLGAFDVSSDVEAIWNVYFNKKTLLGEGSIENKKNNSADYTEYGYDIDGDIVSLTEGHEALFNELFSRYAIVLADTVLICSGRTDNHKLDEILEQNIKKAFDYYSQDEIKKVQAELRLYIQDSELINEEGKSRFILENGNYLYNVLPLTKMELRWLLTVLEDPLSRIFLQEDQIDSIKKALLESPMDIKQLHLAAINYFDRYNIENKVTGRKKNISQAGRHSDKELHFIRTVYQAIKNQTRLRIEYFNWEGKKLYANCSPVWIEYSRRDDIFRVWYVQNEKNQIRKINIPRVTKIIILSDKRYNKNEQREKMKDLYEATMTSIKVEFYQGDRNLPDRILTEFSLWKKKCTYDVSTSKYTMTLYYSTLDEKEIMIRLLSYGPYIRIVASDDNYVLSELKRRIVIQRDLIRERDFEQGEDNIREER